VLIAVIACGLALFLATWILAPLALGEENRIMVDLGLSGITLLGMLVVLLVGGSLVAKEIERKTVYNLLSRPITRHEYLIGKWLGLTGTLWVMCAALGVGLWISIALRGLGAYGPVLMQAVFLCGLELSLMASTAVLFSALSTPVLSALYTLGLFLVGQWSYDLRAYAHSMPAESRWILDTVSSVVPNLPIFNMRSLASVGDPTTLVHLATATAYALLYAGCALALATAAFESRDFK
jgi:ABC-type transport system involved in multi-copper enzyme maturation permease subunit